MVLSPELYLIASSPILDLFYASNKQFGWGYKRITSLCHIVSPSCPVQSQFIYLFIIIFFFFRKKPVIFQGLFWNIKHLFTVSKGSIKDGLYNYVLHFSWLMTPFSLRNLSYPDVFASISSTLLCIFMPCHKRWRGIMLYSPKFWVSIHWSVRPSVPQRFIILCPLHNSDTVWNIYMKYVILKKKLGTELT